MSRLLSSSGIAVAALTAVVLAGCAAPAGPGYYYRGEAMRPQSVEMGVVENVRPVALQAPDTGVGTVGGAALGGLAGSAAGQGAGQAAAIVGGAILGGLIGNTVERDANRRPGLELTVRLDNGRMIAVVQDDTGEPFRPGDRIRVLSNGYLTRVSH
ncbi:MAG TPA: glycine zipper 2TM domain-containing protein [Vicinamibacterales bacterium]|jgi:outer membrane lipoprotein SlyB